MTLSLAASAASAASAGEAWVLFCAAGPEGEPVDFRVDVARHRARRARSPTQ